MTNKKYLILDIDVPIPVVRVRNDPDYILSNETGPCWWCGRETFLVEINYQGYMCGSWADEEEIAADLKRRNQANYDNI